jgi:fatty-acyl-CoA synthase
VVGVPDPKWGEVACAVVVKKEAALTEAGVLGLFENRLARYKHPKRVVFLDQLPRNAMGKVPRDELRRLVAPG